MHDGVLARRFCQAIQAEKNPQDQKGNFPAAALSSARVWQEFAPKWFFFTRKASCAFSQFRALGSIKELPASTLRSGGSYA